MNKNYLLYKNVPGFDAFDFLFFYKVIFFSQIFDVPSVSKVQLEIATKEFGSDMEPFLLSIH
jgi:hypothetical protein